MPTKAHVVDDGIVFCAQHTVEDAWKCELVKDDAFYRREMDSVIGWFTRNIPYLESSVFSELHTSLHIAAEAVARNTGPKDGLFVAKNLARIFEIATSGSPNERQETQDAYESRDFSTECRATVRNQTTQ